MMLSSDTAYRSFGGEVEASSTPTICRLPDSRRHQLSAIALFEACSAFTRVTACTLALSPIRDTLIEGFSHFVTSMTAPIASGWSVCRVGLAPTGKRRLVTAHTQSRHQPDLSDFFPVVFCSSGVL